MKTRRSQRELFDPVVPRLSWLNPGQQEKVTNLLGELLASHVRKWRSQAARRRDDEQQD